LVAGKIRLQRAAFGIVARICELRGTEVPSPLDSIEPFREFVAQARSGDQAARQVFSQAGTMLGTAAANMINERDPGRIIVMSFEPEMIPMIAASFSAALEQNTLPPGASRAQVQFKSIDVDHYRKGSAALALEQIYRG
jgi:predicted NBD/HSP70 family sugar kinase